LTVAIDSEPDLGLVVMFVKMRYAADREMPAGLRTAPAAWRAAKTAAPAPRPSMVLPD
jgi:hypothetical protein